MLLFVHILAGAVLVAKIKPLFFALVLAFLSHYFLDFLTHQFSEYSISNIQAKRWKESLYDFSKVGLDILIGLSLVYIFVGKEIDLFIGVFFAILADGLTLLNLVFPNKVLETHEQFHKKIQH